MHRRTGTLASMLLIAAIGCHDQVVEPNTPQNDSYSVVPGSGVSDQEYFSLFGHFPRPTFTLTVLHNNDGESELLPDGDVGGVARFATVVRQLQHEAREGWGLSAVAGAHGDSDPDGEGAVAASRLADFGWDEGDVVFDEATQLVALDRGGVVHASWLGSFFRRGSPLSSAVTVSSGDNFLAGPQFNASLEGGVPFHDGLALREVGYDAIAVGNHEFDFGPEVLADFISSFGRRGPPFLSANLDVGPEPELAALEGEGRIARSTIVQVRGARIGVIGATTPLLPSISSPRNVIVTSDVANAVMQEVHNLRRRLVNRIILISHLQSVQEDLALVPMLDYVDVVVASVEGPVEEAVAALEATVVGTSEVVLDGVRARIRTQETNEGNLVADAFLWQAQQLAGSFGVATPVVAFGNGGGIRNDSEIPAGPISALTTFSIAPFGNFVSVVPGVPRSQFKELLENAVSRVEFVDGRFAHATGFSFFARGGDQYPFRGLPFTSLGVTDQQALQAYIATGLGGVIGAADYPVGGEGRITRIGG